MTDAQATLERVTQVPGVKGSLLISGTDGLVVAERLMDGIDGRAIAALAASLVQRLDRATQQAGMPAPTFVHLRGNNGSGAGGTGPERPGAGGGHGNRCKPGPRPGSDAGCGGSPGLMRALEPWVAAPLQTFITESSARLILLMTTSGQVVAQHGFSRSVEVMTAAALGAAIVASTEELARLMGTSRFAALVHGGNRQSCMLSAFGTPRGRWIGLVVFGSETSVGLVQLFFDQMVEELVAGGAPGAAGEPAVA